MMYSHLDTILNNPIALATYSRRQHLELYEEQDIY